MVVEKTHQRFQIIGTLQNGNKKLELQLPGPYPQKEDLEKTRTKITNPSAPSPQKLVGNI